MCLNLWLKFVKTVSKWTRGRMHFRAFKSSILMIVLLGSTFGNIAHSQSGKEVPPESAPSSAQMPSQRSDSPAGLASNPDSASGEQFTPAKEGYIDADFSSFAFSATMWVCGIGSGLLSYAFFLYLNTKRRSAHDWIWPLLPVLFLGYFLVFLPAFLYSPIYGEWSEKCLNSELATTNRNPPEASSDAACGRAQTSHSALALGAVVGGYRQYVLNGRSDILFPNELKRLAGILLAMSAGLIYFILLGIRKRFISNR